jgi:hypothetical protein
MKLESALGKRIFSRCPHSASASSRNSSTPRPVPQLPLHVTRDLPAGLLDDWNRVVSKCPPRLMIAGRGIYGLGCWLRITDSADTYPARAPLTGTSNQEDHADSECV